MKSFTYLLFLTVTAVTVACAHSQAKDARSIAVGVMACPCLNEYGAEGKGVAIGAMACDKEPCENVEPAK